MKNLSTSSLHLDNEFYSNFFRISIPIAMQSFMAASLNLVDNIMVGQLGDASIAGVGLANQFFFILNLILLGVNGASAIFLSQFWGSRNISNIKKILGLSLILAISSAMLFFLVGYLFPEKVLAVFSKDPEVIASGSSFLRIISFSYILMAVSSCYATALRTTERVTVPMITSIAALIINTVLNYMLIFGKFGFPALGVAGSATATLIARVIEVIILLVFVYAKNEIVAAKIKELFDIPISLVKRFMTTSSAVIFKDVIWAVGMTVYMIVYARIGTEAAASINIVNTIRQLAFVLFVGVGNACLIMVGNQIGADSPHTAYRYAKKFLKIAVGLGIITGSLVILLRSVVLSPYNVSQEVIQGANNILLIFGFAIVLDVFNMVSVVGIMRSGGDINFCIIMDTIAVWLIGLPLAIISGMVLHLQVHWVFAAVTLQELFKFILCFKRVVSRKWINNLVHDINNEPVKTESTIPVS
ncbi:MAG: MATE family efflux transporter [Clostridia bacterium]|nr:MATE family efflux transporter [Clostridia bacterium]